MKKLNFWLLASLFVAAFAFTACSSSDSDGGGGGGDTPAPGPGGDPGHMVYATLQGIVTDEWDQNLSGVKVTTAGKTYVTKGNGNFVLDAVSVVDGMVVVKFEKDDYQPVVRSFPEGSQNHLKVVMIRQNTYTFAPATGLDISLDNSYTDEEGNYHSSTGNMKIELPADANAYVNGTTPYTGQVKAAAVYLNPDETSTFGNAMPGDLSATRTDGSGVELISGGMVAVELTGENGEKLQLASGKKAKLTFPKPNKIKQNPPTSMPLMWAFNEAKGIWEEEAVSVTETATEWVAEVTHFSWHNLDYPESRCDLKVKVVDMNGTPMKNIQVDIDGERAPYTNDEGVATCRIPANQKLYVRVKPKDIGGAAETRMQVGPFSGGSKPEVTLQLKSRAPMISGVVNNTGSGSKVCTIFISYPMMQKTASVVSDLNGAYQIFAPSSYRGKATINALFADGTLAQQEFEITDADQRIDFTVDSSSGAAAGSIKVTGSDLNISYQVADPSGAPLQVTKTVLSGRTNFRIQYQVGDGDPHTTTYYYIDFDITNYSESASTFENASFSYNRSGHGAGYITLDGTGTLTIERSGTNYTFKMNNVPCKLMDVDRNIDNANVNATFEIGATLK